MSGGAIASLVVMIAGCVVILVAFILYVVRLGQLRKQVSAEDYSSVNLLWIITLAQIVFAVVGGFVGKMFGGSVLSFMQFLTTGFALIFLIVNVMCYYKLKNSDTFSEQARQGMAYVFYG